MKRIQLHSVWLATLVALFLSGPAARADDAKVGAATPPAPAVKASTETKPTSDEPKQESTEPAKEDSQARLLAMFKKEQSITNTLGMVMVWLPAGYRVAEYEVTQSQYQKLMGNNPSKFPGSQHPVENVTLSEASQFCKKLTDQEIADKKLPKGYYYSLPSEAQWEYYVDEADLKNAVTAYYGDRYNPENVGIFPPNKFGLYDTRGSVWDLCDDGAGRGGSWRSYDDYVYINFRFIANADQRYDDIGFRIVLQGSGTSEQ